MEIPGNPSRVRDQATSMVKAAERMRGAAATLQRIDRGAYESDAVDAVFVNTTEVAHVLRGASTRYRGTGEALQEYAEVLDSAQQQAREANDRLAATNVDGARWEVASKQVEVSNPLLLLPDREADRDQVHRELVQARQELHAQESQAAEAHEQLQRAKDDVDQAAEEAIRRIHIAVEDSGLKDAVWDDAKGWFDRNLENIQAVLDVVSTVLGVVALLTAWIPVVGLVFGVLAAVTTIASLAITAYQFSKGDVGWREALVTTAFAVVSLIPGMRGLKTLNKIRQAGHVPAAISKGVGRRLAKPSRIFFHEEPGRAALPGVAKRLGLPEKGTYYEGMGPDAVRMGVDEWVKRPIEDKIKDGAKDLDQKAAAGGVRCVATSTGSSGGW